MVGGEAEGWAAVDREPCCWNPAEGRIPGRGCSLRPMKGHGEGSIYQGWGEGDTIQAASASAKERLGRKNVSAKVGLKHRGGSGWESPAESQKGLG